MQVEHGHKILRRHEVVERTGLNRNLISELERRGEFPARRRLSTRASGWIEAEIDNWILTRPLAADVPPDPASDLPRR